MDLIWLINLNFLLKQDERHNYIIINHSLTIYVPCIITWHFFILNVPFTFKTNEGGIIKYKMAESIVCACKYYLGTRMYYYLVLLLCETEPF